MKVWFKEYPDLLGVEINELEINNIRVKVDEVAFAKDIVILDCIVPKVNTIGLELEEDLLLKINFPDNFPYFRPEVSSSNISLPRHQNIITGNLCLIPRPSQYWNVGESVFDYLSERLPVVLSKGIIIDQKVIGSDPDEQGEPVSEYYCARTNAIVLSTRPNIFENELPDQILPFKILNHGYLDLSLKGELSKVNLFSSFLEGENIFYTPSIDDRSDILKIVVDQWLDCNGEKISNLNAISNIRSRDKIRTKWYQISSLPPPLSKADGFNFFLNELKKIGLQEPKKCNIRSNDYQINYVVGLVFPEETTAGKIGWGWVFLIHGKIIKMNGSAQKIPYSFNLPVFSLDPIDFISRIPKSKGLIGKTISVIGLGAIGAPSVLEFAKNGVSKLKLMDFDIVETTSSVRWPLGIEYAGMHKTEALKRFINLNFPFVEVEIINHKIGSTDFISYPNEIEKLSDFLEGSSLIYDASAEEGVNNLVSTLCKKRKIPYMVIEARRGAWGGLVMRVIPEKTLGCWMCFQYSLSEGKIIQPKQDVKGGIQPNGCGDISFTGSSFDLQNISLAGVRMAVSSLNIENEEMNWDIAILSMVDDYSLSIQPEWKVYPLEINSKCPYCK